MMNDAGEQTLGLILSLSCQSAADVTQPARPQTQQRAKCLLLEAEGNGQYFNFTIFNELSPNGREGGRNIDLTKCCHPSKCNTVIDMLAPNAVIQNKIKNK